MITDKRKIELVWKEFLDMVDGHISWFGERDEDKQPLMRAIYDYKTKLFQKKVRRVYGQ